MLDLDRAAEPDDLVGPVAALDPGPALVGVPLALQALAADAAISAGVMSLLPIGFRIRSSYILDPILP
jgi:hypothetical protein